MFAEGIFLFNLLTRHLDQLTYGTDFAAVWSPDGSEVIFASKRGTAFQLYRKRTSGAGGDMPLLTGEEDTIPTDWSSDGKFLLYRSADSHNSFDIRGVVACR